MKLLSESHLPLRGALHGCASILCLHNVLCFQPWAVRPMAKDTRHIVYKVYNDMISEHWCPCVQRRCQSCCLLLLPISVTSELTWLWLWHDRLDYLRLDTQMPPSLGLKLSSIHQIPVLRHPWNQTRGHEWQRAITKHRAHFG